MKTSVDFHVSLTLVEQSFGEGFIKIENYQQLTSAVFSYHAENTDWSEIHIFGL